MDNSKPTEFLQVMQMIILFAAAAAVFLNLGRRDEKLEFVSLQIDELRLVSQDLVKSQIIGTAEDRAHENLMRDLKSRVIRLEQP